MMLDGKAGHSFWQKRMKFTDCNDCCKEELICGEKIKD